MPPGGHRRHAGRMSESAPDITRQILEALDLPTDPVFVRLITTPDPWQAKMQRYREELPGRTSAVAAEVNRRYADLLPEGMRFEWTGTPAG